LAQQGLAQSAPHFLASAFLSLEALQAEHSAFFSAFFGLQPQVSQAYAAVPAIINAIAAILIILFMLELLIFCLPTVINDQTGLISFKTIPTKSDLSRIT
jgi:hypothetical protein